MARLNSNEGEQLINFLRPGPAATQDANNFSDAENLYDKLYKSLNQNITNCEYFEVNSQIVNGFYDDALILVHVNIRSLHKNFDLFYEFNQSFQFIPRIICIRETRIKYQPQINVSIPNYGFAHVNSNSNAGGVATVCIFIKTLSTEVESSRTDFEVLGLEGQVLGLGLEASSPRKLACPRLEDSTIF